MKINCTEQIRIAITIKIFIVPRIAILDNDYRYGALKDADASHHFLYALIIAVAGVSLLSDMRSIKSLSSR